MGPGPVYQEGKGTDLVAPVEYFIPVGLGEGTVRAPVVLAEQEIEDFRTFDL